VEDLIFLRPHIQIVHRGALDGLRLEDIPVGGGDYPIFTRLQSGNLISVERKNLLPLLQKKLDELEGEEVDAILVMCTAAFPELVSRRPLIIPFELFGSAFVKMGLRNRVGVICPLEDQKLADEKKWRQIGLNPIIWVASPFCDSGMSYIVGELQREKLEMVILDCYAFGEKAKKELSKHISCPVVSIRTVVVGMLAEFF
jgi:protein AroM